MADDDLTATLAGIRDEAQSSIAYADDHACPDLGNSCSAHHALRLLAAVDAVLKLTADWDAEAARLEAVAAKADTETPGTQNRAWAHRDCADALREVITRELAGDNEQKQ